jgi:hypothetical protein
MVCDNCGKEGARIRYVTRSYGKGDNLLIIENRLYRKLNRDADASRADCEACRFFLFESAKISVFTCTWRKCRCLRPKIGSSLITDKVQCACRVLSSLRGELSYRRNFA